MHNFQHGCQQYLLQVLILHCVYKLSFSHCSQSFGGMGLAQDTPLAPIFAMARVIRIADGPDEVHLKSIFRMEARTQNLAKL
jgi:hypothetical protein